MGGSFPFNEASLNSTPINLESSKGNVSSCAEPEAVFGQAKYNMAYKRFRHFGLDKVTMDFAFSAIAFNIKKMCSRAAKQAKNGGNTPPTGPFLRIYRITCPKNRLFLKFSKKSLVSSPTVSQAA